MCYSSLIFFKSSVYTKCILPIFIFSLKCITFVSISHIICRSQVSTRITIRFVAISWVLKPWSNKKLLFLKRSIIIVDFILTVVKIVATIPTSSLMNDDYQLIKEIEIAIAGLVINYVTNDPN